MNDEPLPPVVYRARLHELEGCWLDIACAGCRGKTTYPIRLLIQRVGGTHHIGAVIPHFVCKACKAKPSAIYLCETAHREARNGPPPGWSVQLYPLNG